MATLAEVTWETRIILKIAAVILTVLTVVFLFFKGGTIIKTIFFPTPPPPPDEKYGILQPINFPTQKPTTYTYRLNTVTEKLPVFPDRMKVYKIKQDTPTLNTLQKLRNKLLNSRFSERETKITETKYQWSKTSGETIAYNTVTNNFSINSGYLTSSLSEFGYPISKKADAYNLAIDFLETIRVDSSDVTLEKSTLTFYKIASQALTKVESQNDANVARLDLFQTDIEKDLKIHYPDFDKSIMYFIFETKGGRPQIAESQYNHYVPDTTDFATYSIKTPDQAFEDLNNGNALIFNENIDKSAIIDITDVSLGYYAGEENQQFLLPIVVFKGDGFIAYTRALAEKTQIPAQ